MLKSNALLKIALLASTMATAWGSQALAESIKVQVNGMVCGFCAQGISKKLMDSGSVKKADVDLDAKIVSIETLKDKTIDDKTLTSIIVDAGYQVVKITRSPE
jgi:copper chaperone CopZ